MQAKLSRRNIVAAAAAGSVVTAAAVARAASFGNPDEPPQGAINTQGNPSSATDPGPNNPAITNQFPGAFSPPATGTGELPLFWASFNNAPRRIQNGGWARQVTQYRFPDFRNHRRREYAPDAGRNSRAALAPHGGMGLCHAWLVPHHDHRPVRPFQCGGCTPGWALVFPGWPAAFAPGYRRGRLRVHHLLR